MTTKPISIRETLIAEAFRLEGLTIAWMVVEGAPAVTFGIIAHSITLLAFGTIVVSSCSRSGYWFGDYASNLTPEKRSPNGPKNGQQDRGGVARALSI